MIREKETEPLHYRVSRLGELPRPVDRENYLEERVRQARKLGVSYGVYMAMLHEGRIEDPLRAGRGADDDK